MRINRREFVAGAAGLLIPRRMVHGALVNGANASDRFTVTAAASINDLSAATVILWLRCTTITSGRFIWSKSANKNVRIGNVSGDIRAQYGTSGVQGRNDTNTTPLATPQWVFFAWAFDHASPPGHIYIGTQNTLAVEATYSINNTATGSILADTGTGTDDLVALNLASAPTANAFQGEVALHQYHNAMLSLAQIQRQQMQPEPVASCVAFHIINKVGTITDLSGNGNDAVVTGSTLIPDMLPFPVGNL